MKEIFTRYAHGETPSEIMKDMIDRNVPPLAGDRWKLLQITRMLHNEKYTGDVVLQKHYIDSHLTHREVRNYGEVPLYHIHNAHTPIIDRHIFAQAAAVSRMRQVKTGNSSYPYDAMLKCPHFGETLVHGALYPVYFGGNHVQNGGRGYYGPKGCKQFLMIQNVLDDALLAADQKRYGERPERVDHYWLDDLITHIKIEEDAVNIYWKDGREMQRRLNFPHEHYQPEVAAKRYNEHLEKVRKGEAKTKGKFLWGFK